MKYKLFQAQKEFFPIMPQAKLNSRWQRCNFLSSYSCTFTLPNLLIVKQNKPMKYKLFQARTEGIFSNSATGESKFKVTEMQFFVLFCFGSIFRSIIVGKFYKVVLFQYRDTMTDK